MSELTEKLWAVLSERGCESTGQTYAQALELMRSLQREKVSGLSIITDAAASRADDTRKPRTGQQNRNGTKAQVKR